MDYDKSLHAGYAAGRKLATETVTAWMDAVASHLPAREGLRVLDLGSGIGRFSVPLAERLGAVVVGVEPSEKMRAQARADRGHPQVRYVGGTAEWIPFDDGSFDAVFLSMVLHHFSSMPDACEEIARVLRPEGRLCVRSAYKHVLDSVLFYDYFPSARAIDEARLPSIEEWTSCCQDAGLHCIAHETITQQIDESFRAHTERLKHKALSTFELISDEEFRAGIEAMEKVAQAETDPEPVIETFDLLVFQKGAA